MTDRHVRVSARGVVRRGEELLVERGRDPATGDSFYSLLGGGVRFGEHTEDALRREFDEELGVTLERVSSLGTYEEVFAVDGETRHEVWRVYEADIAESWPYEVDEFEGNEPERDEVVECVWKPPSAFADGGETLYPEGLVSEL
ncbi:NUDIX domain-containing protein [Halorussus salilacus]|uniref:NUDIX hydrolase n=1 Tax=Halorussus salilacus TaxID=2953750 RepID=UPI00209FFCA9|nr:NUDIX domain-containing protein [Halorussus salilacus]USZ67766.1 NUDIX domain-containing protein [Halorussus salilacus]